MSADLDLADSEWAPVRRVDQSLAWNLRFQSQAAGRPRMQGKGIRANHWNSLVFLKTGMTNVNKTGAVKNDSVGKPTGSIGYINLLLAVIES